MTHPVVVQPDARPASRGRLHQLATFLALSFWIFGLIAVGLWWVLDLILLPRRPLLALSMLSLKVLLMVLPLRIPPPRPIQHFLRFSMEAAGHYFPVRVVWEGKQEDYSQGPFVIGYEPHSVLPQGICVFCQYATDAVPAGLRNARILVSSAGFTAPILRHMWWWLGCRPVSRACFAELLRKGRSVALCPGGVQECTLMRRGEEVVYLRKRHGFVRMALQAGSPLVPVFCFGQTDLYSYWRLFFDWPKHLIPKSAAASFVRRIGYVPLLAFGWMGTFMPKRVPLYIVVGKPIAVDQVEHPTPQQIDDLLQQFIGEMERLFQEHRKAAGHEHTQLTIY